MAFRQFPKDLYVSTLDTGDKPYMGGFVPGSGMELQYGLLHIYKQGLPAGTENLRVNIYTDLGANTIYTSSEWLAVADIEDDFLLDNNWLGTIRFDFNREPLNPNFTYYLRLESNNYSRDGDNYFISYLYDWPFSVNDQASSQAGARIEFYGYE